MVWSIHYPNYMFTGETAADWRRAPDTQLQVVRGPSDYEGGGGWIGVRHDDRSLWTGQDEYDPFGWGIKYGSAIDDDLYWRIWIAVAYDGNPPESERLHPARRV